MTKSMYYRCRICGSVCNLKYQIGYSRKHPIRYKCSCGILIRGLYEEGKGIDFENADKVDQTLPAFVVYSSGEFFTVPPFSVTTFKQTVGTFPPPFILATMMLEYEDYRKEFSHIIFYRDNSHSSVRAINELYAARNYEKVKEVIRNKFDPEERLFPLNNEVDLIRAVTMINQFQFLNHDGINRTPKTTSYLLDAFKNHTSACIDYLSFIKSLDRLETWKKQVHSICNQIYEKIDLIMPAVSIDFVKDKENFDFNRFAITTTSFEDIKQLYVDLYELIGSLLFLAIGIDNILLRGDYNSLKVVQGIDVNSLQSVIKMRNKGNIIKLIDENAPIESMICRSLNSDIRNSIGHYSYIADDVSDSFGQQILFADQNNKEKTETRSLLHICYDIWQMYKTLGIFNEIIHHLEIQLLSLEGKLPSFMTDPVTFSKLVKPISNKKIYPNDLCPCGSGIKYKKCCGR